MTNKPKAKHDTSGSWAILIFVVVMLYLITQPAPTPAPTITATPVTIPQAFTYPTPNPAATLTDLTGNTQRLAQIQQQQSADATEIAINYILTTECPTGCATSNPNCLIKGNISIDTGAKIYHLPSQKFYAQTIINPQYGERWFCTESEAIANGWRRSAQ